MSMNGFSKIAVSGFAVFLFALISGLPIPAPALGSGDEGMSPITGHTGPKKYSYMILNPEELKACVGLGTSMVTLKKDLPGMEQKLAAQEEELKALKTDMENKKKAQSGTKADLDAYNKVVESYNAKVEAYKKDAARFNDSAEKHNGAMEEYKKNCAGWKFYQEDYDALSKGGGK